MKRVIALLIFLVVSSPILAGDFENGFAAASFGDWKTAFNLWKPLAEKDDARAQYHLAVLYDEGKGVPQDPEAALQWYRKAAEQCHSGAQRNLGLMLNEGRIEPADSILSYKWLSIAANAGSDTARSQRDKLAQRMSEKRIDQAQRLASSWLESHCSEKLAPVARTSP
ncbi:tetratricopeptide repeat protein [Halomonas shantousis]